jgi:hypothetical protein
MTAMRMLGAPPALLELADRYVDFHRQRGNDPHIGLRLGELLRGAGLTVLDHSGTFGVMSLPPGLRPPSWAARDAMVAEGVASPDDVARWGRALEQLDARRNGRRCSCRSSAPPADGRPEPRVDDAPGDRSRTVQLSKEADAGVRGRSCGQPWPMSRPEWTGRAGSDREQEHRGVRGGGARRSRRHRRRGRSGAARHRSVGAPAAVAGRTRTAATRPWKAAGGLPSGHLAEVPLVADCVLAGPTEPDDGRRTRPAAGEHGLPDGMSARTVCGMKATSSHARVILSTILSMA